MIFEKSTLVKAGISDFRCLPYFVLLALIGLVNGSCKVGATTELGNPEKNTAALTRAQDNIEKFRKGAARIRVLDSRGKPASDVRLEIRQVSHAFKFGCYLKIDDLDQTKLPEYERRFKDLFNYAVIGTYWDFIETKRGDENWKWFDQEAAMTAKLGIETAAAPVLWGTNKFGRPRWLPTNEADLLPILERRVRSSVTRNDRIVDWEVVNEPLAPKGDFFAHFASQKYVASAFNWAKDAAPAKRLMINEYGVFGSLTEHKYNSTPYYEMLEELIAKGVPLDVIGIQAHANGEWFEPANVSDELEKYSGLGKPIQITEFSVQTLDFKNQRSPLPISGKYRTGFWDGEKQAEFYREFYTIAFGTPQVEAIVTWGLDEGRAWLPGIGLIDKNGGLKPAYNELQRLINREWKSQFEAKTDGQGVAEINGFFGDYEVVATTAAGKAISSQFKLLKGQSNDWVVRLGS